MKVQAESFHLNGHIIGFRLQTQKLDSPYKTPSSTLAVKGLTLTFTSSMSRFCILYLSVCFAVSEGVILTF